MIKFDIVDYPKDKYINNDKYLRYCYKNIFFIFGDVAYIKAAIFKRMFDEN